MPGPPPAPNEPHFVCPHADCQVDSTMTWWSVYVGHNKEHDKQARRAHCHTCMESSYWIGDQMVWPAPLLGDQASVDLPADVLELYNEARVVVSASPRAAAALLRLAVERLVVHLGEETGKLHVRIGRLKKRGDITRRTIDALDAVRITGNAAVHEGQIDPVGDDDLPIALLLFQVVNRIAEDTIGMGRRVTELGRGKLRPPDDQ